MAGDDSLPRMKANSLVTQVHFQAQDLMIVDRILEPQTIPSFLESCLGRPLPNGKASIYPPLSAEDALAATTTPSEPDGKPIMECIMSRIGSWEDGGRLLPLGKNIQSIKYRLWDGLVPISDQRWKEKGLHQSENFDIACQHLTSVIAVFEYLNQPVVAKNRRDTFNLIWEHWKELDEVNNERRAQNGEEPVSAADRWSEFIVAHYEMMTSLAHHWVISHLEKLRIPLLTGLDMHVSLTSPFPVPTRWQLMDRLHMLCEIASIADLTIRLPVYDYKGCNVPSDHPSRVPFAERKKSYHLQLRILNRTAAAVQAFPGANPNSLLATAIAQIENEKQLRGELRGNPVDPVPREPWIVKDLSVMGDMTVNQPPGYSVFIYRLTHGQTDEEWATFVQKLETHIGDWARGTSQYDDIASRYKLHWLDGKTLNIPDGDIDAARERFQNFDISSKELTNKIVDSFFLVVDSTSFDSYMGNTYTAATGMVLPGDFTGFVLAVDADYDPKEGPGRPDESPGYCGQMRVLGSLIWTELYAMHTSQNALLEDLWPLAIHHPNYVYVGPTVPCRCEVGRCKIGCGILCFGRWLNMFR